MTIQESGPLDGDVAEMPTEPVASRSLVPGAVTVRSAGPPLARPRTGDYRLRGLDLEAPSLSPAPPKPVGKRHPDVRRHRRRTVVLVLTTMLVAIGAAVVVHDRVVQPFAVTTASMAPTLEPGTKVLVVKPRALVGDVGVGDIVVLRQPDGRPCGGDGRLIKRVIAKGGDVIWSDLGILMVNGVELVAPDWQNPLFGADNATPIPYTQVPAGSLYVMGDNRSDECDSRAFGPVDGSLVEGQVVATVARDGHPSFHLF